MTTHWNEVFSSRGLRLTVLLAVTLTFAVRSYRVFGPDSVYVQPFNSDSALPVLMANDSTLDLFRAYIYGQDQIGAWPFLLGQLVHKVTGVAWTPRSIYLAQVAWLSLSIVLAASLCRPYGLLICLVVAIVFTLNESVSHYFFVLNQRNAWQCSSFFLAWFCLRRVCEQLSAKTKTSSIPLSLLALAVASFLAIWSSSLDGPFLLAIAVLELLRLRILNRSQVFSATILIKVFSPLIIGITCEAILKACYHRYSFKHFGSDFKTPTELDWENIGANFSNQWIVFIQQHWWTLAVIGTVASLAASAYLISTVVHKTNSLNEGVGLTNLLLMIAGCGVIAWGSFLVTVLFTWVRLNAYGPRYLAQTNMFGSLAGMISLVFLARLLAGAVIESGKVLIVALVVGAVIWLVKFPPVQTGREYAALQAVANGLVEKEKHPVVLGGYWDTYVLAALASPGQIVPVPATDQLMRTPWTVQQMRQSPFVTLVHHKFYPQAVVETPASYDTFGDGQNPPSKISQYGVDLRLVTPKWYEQNGYVFSLYSNDSALR